MGFPPRRSSPHFARRACNFAIFGSEDGHFQHLVSGSQTDANSKGYLSIDEYDHAESGWLPDGKPQDIP
ncbi:MAG: hypothetical protein V1897_08980 [Pseudomonadota bacterium]